MNGRSLTMQTAAALTGLMLSATVAHAAELKVFTSVALTNALDALAPIFEQKTGNKLTISYDLAAVQKKRILDGERADVIILTRVMMDDLAKQNKLAPGNIVNVAATPVALAVRAGAPKPDISTADAFKQALLSAKSIAYADPAKGGLSGVVASRAIERLGIAEQMKPKTNSCRVRSRRTWWRRERWSSALRRHRRSYRMQGRNWLAHCRASSAQ